MSMIETVLGDVLSPLLDGLEKLDGLVAEAIEKMGEGIEFVGDEAVKLGELVDRLAPKLEALRQKLHGGSA